jgi:hypothetical protein
MKGLAASLAVFAWIVPCDFQQSLAPKSGEASQPSSCCGQGKAQSGKQSSEDSASAHHASNTPANDRQQEDFKKNQNVYTSAPERPIDSVEGLISMSSESFAP